MDGKHLKDFERRLEVRACGKASVNAPKLPLALPSYVPPGMELKDYQIEGVHSRHMCCSICEQLQPWLCLPPFDKDIASA